MSKKTTVRAAAARPAKKSGPPWALIAIAAAIVLVGAVVLFQVLGGGQAAAPAPGATSAALPTEVSIAEAAKKRDAGAFILDVRTPEEWNEFHVPGATLIPVTELPNRVAEVPKEREVVVVCRSGNRSATGRDILLKAGFPKVTSMAGGLVAWRNAGYPTE